MNKLITIYAGQNIFDIALQEYGSRTAVFKVIKDNHLVGLNATLEPGQVLNIIQAPDRPDVVKLLQRNGTKVNTGDTRARQLLDGISVWAINQDFIVTPNP